MSEAVFSSRTRQVGGDHYLNMGVQPWDAAEHWGSKEEFYGYMRFTALSYLARAGHKDEYQENIRKAHHTLERLIESFDKE